MLIGTILFISLYIICYNYSLLYKSRKKIKTGFFFFTEVNVFCELQLYILKV